MTMDLKDIIKWFIPCFHILLIHITGKMNVLLTILCLVVLFNPRHSFAAIVNSDNHVDISHNNLNTKNIDITLNTNDNNIRFNQSERSVAVEMVNDEEREKSKSAAVGRTFGRPFKKMAAALIPLVFQMGAAATWAVVAALVGIKTLGVTLLILKLLLIAGAVKIGALFGHKGHQSHDWEPPHQKEIHLHIHNGHHSTLEEHPPLTTWSRDGSSSYPDVKTLNQVYDPYVAGPQTISTPFGNYVKIDKQHST